MSHVGRARARVLAISAVAAMAWACAETVTPVSPTAATTPAISDLSTVTICHRIEGSGPFTRTEIPAAATTTHLAHGDAFPGHFVPGANTQRFDPTCAQTAVINATIAFKYLTTTGLPITSYEEEGFRITAETGPWGAHATFGSPAPMAIFKRPASSEDMSGRFAIRSTSGLFAFTSVDFYSSVTPIPHTIAGYLESRDVLALTSTVPNTFGKFAKVTNPNAPQMLDVLFINVVNPATPCCGNPVGLDNIVLKR